MTWRGAGGLSVVNVLFSEAFGRIRPWDVLSERMQQTASISISLVSNVWAQALVSDDSNAAVRIMILNIKD